MVIEANHKRGNEIEFLSEIGQRPKSFNSLNYAANAEQIRNFAEHWQTIHIKAQSGMTQQLGDVQEISCAAAKIENSPGARQIQFDLANSPDVDSDPTIQIEIFRPVCARICYRVTFANLCEPNWIDRFNDPVLVQRKPTGSEKPERMFSSAGQALAVDEFAYFMSKPHLKMNHSL